MNKVVAIFIFVDPVLFTVQQLANSMIIVPICSLETFPSRFREQDVGVRSLLCSLRWSKETTSAKRPYEPLLNVILHDTEIKRYDRLLVPANTNTAWICSSKASTRGTFRPHLVSRDGWNSAPLSRSPLFLLQELGKRFNMSYYICSW